MVNLAAAGKIKKRVIAASSDESDSEGGKPLAKRPKSEDAAAAAPPSSSQDSPAHDVKPNGTSAGAMLAAAMADASSDEDVPMADSSQPVVAPTANKPGKETNGAAAANGKSKKRPAESDLSEPSSSSEDEQPMAKATTSSKPKPQPRKSVAKKAKQDDSDEEDGDDYDEEQEEDVKPKKKARKSNGRESKGNGKSKSSKGKAKAAKKEDSDDSDSEAPMAKKPPPKAKAKAKAKSESASPVKKPKGKKDETESAEGSEDEEFKWWEAQKDDDSKKWDSLQHNGVLFPPEYVPLPKKVKMLYDSKPVDLPPESEEVATFFGSMLNTDHVQKAKFCENFFDDFKDVLKDHPPRDGTKIKEFTKCDFQPIFDYFEIEREKKKSLTKEEKKALKTQKDELEEPFKYCLLDGRKEKVGNFRVEPPSLFRGRGEHPKTGMLKKRIAPEQITINCGEKDPVPQPPAGHQWAKVIHNDKASWLAMWKENINGAFKYVFLAAGSSLKGQSDMKKFEKARTLKDHIDRIRRDYTSELTDKTMATRQRATAMYLIDRLALRAGNEKGEDEADTVGCCSLRFEHVTLSPPNTVTFDFLGKDSIRFFQQVQVDEQVFKNLKIFKRDPKDVGDLIFDRLTTTLLNKHLSEYMPGLSAKVFRTYNASWTFEQQLEKTPKDASVADKILAYNRANREVAVLCNHQRSVSKTHGAAMEKAFDRIRALKYQHRRLRWQLINADGYTKKKHGAYNQEESDLEDDWIEQHESDLYTKEREKITKKFEKDNAKLKEGGEKEMKPKELEERLEAADELKKRLKSERKAKKVEGRGDADKVVAQISKMQERIAAAKTAATDRDEGKETSLGTSKINYIDPRLTFAWCAKHDVPVEKMFSKTLREKFTWAAGTDADWKF